MMLLKRRERTPLRGPLIHRKDRPSSITPALRNARMSLSTRLSGYPRGGTGHQAIMINSVEKFFPNRDQPRHCSLSNVTCAWAAPDGPSVPDGIRNCARKTLSPPALVAVTLQHGLLDQSVDDARHAEFSDPAFRLGYFDPLNRLWLVGSVEQLRPYVWPVLTQKSLASSMVIPSTPGLPWFLRTRFHALCRFSPSHTSSMRCSVTTGLSGAGFAANGSALR